MCGIYTFIGTDGINLKAKTDAIHHRGPDAEGFLTFNLDTGESGITPELASRLGSKIAMGFRRLAIIDLVNESNQPMSLEDGRYHIVFNGEIYNYIELRGELETAGIRFYTKSDTEVLLNAYKIWGTNCFNRFNGMWACCIMDFNRKKLVISRDRFGIKPLFYSFNKDAIEFGSEIKQFFAAPLLKKEINENVIRDFLESAILDASDETFFKNIHRFPAGSFAEISWLDEIKEIKPVRFYDLGLEENRKIDYSDAVQQFRTLFQSSIELRFRSDVPVGACLSGGLDSSSIVSYAGFLGKKIHTYTVDNDDTSLSEYRYVESIMKKYPDLTSIRSYNDAKDLELIPTALSIQDEPIGQLGVNAQWRVMKLASEDGVKVLLDGQGGDEIFGGYRKFVFFYLKELISSRKLGLAIKEASRFLTQYEFKLFEKEGVRRYLNMTRVDEFLSEKTASKEKHFNIGISGASGFRQKSYEDIFYFSYPQLLRYEDRNSMAFSLESRVPFLDYRLVEFVYSLPTSFKIRNGYTKSLLRDSMKDILPDDVRLRKSKMGFATPEREWFAQTHRAYFLDYFNRMDNPFLNNRKIYDSLSSGKSSLEYKSLLRLYLFNRWYNHHFNESE